MSLPDPQLVRRDMYLTVLFRCNQSVPLDLRARISAATFLSGNEIMQVRVSHAQDWIAIVKQLAEAGISARGSVSIADNPDHNWKKPKTDWIAAVLEPDDAQAGANLPQDYLPGVGPPERGRVCDDIPLVLERLPEGHMAAVGDNLVMSIRLVEALGGRAAGDYGVPVMLEGAPVHSWTRFTPKARCDEVDPLSVASTLVPCARCKSPYRTFRGLWLGNTDEPFTGSIAVDEIGFGHLDYEHPFVISVEAAKRLDHYFHGKGYTLDPIYARTSQLAN